MHMPVRISMLLGVLGIPRIDGPAPWNLRVLVADCLRNLDSRLGELTTGAQEAT